MKKAKLDVVRGGGNVFRDLGHENADAEQFKSILATGIIKAVDREGLTVRAAQRRTGIAAADFCRIRNADLGRFTVDRLMAILNRLGSRVDVKVRVQAAAGLRMRLGRRVRERRICSGFVPPFVPTCIGGPTQDLTLRAFTALRTPTGPAITFGAKTNSTALSPRHSHATCGTKACERFTSA
jgi:predicted XRE-type DNA-binding protein